jgi:Mrr restriction endonuclease-like protein
LYTEPVPRIDVSTPTYRRLLARASSFDDTGEEVIRRLLDQVEGPQPDAPERGPDKRFGSRATPGSILPEREYWLPILRILDRAGGSAQANDVIDALGPHMEHRLRPADYEVLRMGEVRWRNRARFARLRMKERGLLSDKSSRGIWELTEAGRRYLDEEERRIGF